MREVSADVLRTRFTEEQVRYYLWEEEGHNVELTTEAINRHEAAKPPYPEKVITTQLIVRAFPQLANTDSDHEEEPRAVLDPNRKRPIAHINDPEPEVIFSRQNTPDLEYSPDSPSMRPGSTVPRSPSVSSTASDRQNRVTDYDDARAMEHSVEMAPVKRRRTGFGMDEVILAQYKATKPSSSSIKMTTLASKFWAENTRALALCTTVITQGDVAVLNDLADFCVSFTAALPVNQGPLSALLDLFLEGGRPVFTKQFSEVIDGYSFPRALNSRLVDMFDYTEAQHKGKSFTYAVTRPLKRVIPPYSRAGADCYQNSPTDRIYWFKGVSTYADRLLCFNFVKWKDTASFIYFNDDEICVPDDALPFHVHAVASKTNVLARIRDELHHGSSRLWYRKRLYEGPLPASVLSYTEVQHLVNLHPSLQRLGIKPSELYHAANIVIPLQPNEGTLPEHHSDPYLSPGRFVTSDHKANAVQCKSEIIIERDRALIVPRAVTRPMTDFKDFSVDGNIPIIFGSVEWHEYISDGKEHRRILLLLPYNSEHDFSISLIGVVVGRMITPDGHLLMVYIHTDLRYDADGRPLMVTVNLESMSTTTTQTALLNMLKVPRNNTDGLCAIFPVSEAGRRNIGSSAYAPVSFFLRTVLLRRQ